MRTLLFLLLSSAAIAQTQASKPTCLIIKHASVTRQAFVSGANWQYVEGDFPPGIKWKSNITDRLVRKVKATGGRVVTVPTDYKTADLEDARKQCSAEPAH